MAEINKKALNWHIVDYVDGRKVFNDCSSDTNTLNKELSVLECPTELSIIMPTMERPSKTINTLRSLAQSAINAHMPTEVVVMDNSFNPGLHEVLERTLSTDRVLGSIALRYCYDRTLTFPVARNIGIDLASESSQYLASWDSDIYCSPDALEILFDYWKNNPDIDACAPPLATYNSHNTLRPTYESESIGNIEKNQSDRAKLDMPGRLGDEIGCRRDDAILSTMMRGAYLFTRSFAENVSAKHSEKDLFLRDFTVWSNVPTCMTANEMGKNMAYVINRHAIAFHDLSKDGVSMSKDIPLRIEENLKSLTLLFYREIDQVTAHPDNLLSRFNKAAIVSLLKVNEGVAERIVEYLIGVARLIRESESCEDMAEANNLSKLLPDCQRQNPHLRNFINRLTTPSTYKRIKELKSYNTSVSPYELR